MSYGDDIRGSGAAGDGVGVAHVGENLLANTLDLIVADAPEVWGIIVYVCVCDVMCVMCGCV